MKLEVLENHCRVGEFDYDDQDDASHSEELRILSDVNPEDRTPEEVCLVKEYLNSFIHLRLFFKQLNLPECDTGKIIDIGARHFTLERWPFHRRRIWSSGDPAEHFYLVHRGGIAIQVPFKSREALSTVTEYREGEFFGDIGLMNNRKTRTAGASTCEDNTLLLRLHKTIFLEKFAVHFRRIYERRYEVLSYLPAFRSWPKESLYFLGQIAFRQAEKMGGCIAEEGSHVANKKFIAVLIKGQVRVEKNAYSGSLPARTSTPALGNLLLSGSLGNQSSESEKSSTVSECLPLCMLSPGSTICEQSMLSAPLGELVEICKTERGMRSKVRWTASYLCYTACEIWYIPRHTYFNICPGDNALEDLRSSIMPALDYELTRKAFLQSRLWDNYRARLLKESFACMNDKSRSRILKIAAKNRPSHLQRSPRRNFAEELTKGYRSPLHFKLLQTSETDAYHAKHLRLAKLFGKEDNISSINSYMGGAGRYSDINSLSRGLIKTAFMNIILESHKKVDLAVNEEEKEKPATESAAHLLPAQRRLGGCKPPKVPRSKARRPLQNKSRQYRVYKETPLNRRVQCARFFSRSSLKRASRISESRSLAAQSLPPLSQKATR